MIRAHVGSWEAVLALVRSGEIPAEQVRAPVEVGHDENGLWLEADLPPAVREALSSTGVQLGAAHGGTPFASWLEAVPLSRDTPGETPRVLFRVPLNHLIPLAAELLRLGCDQQSWCRTGDVAWLEVVEPPWYSVLSALEGGERAVFEPLRPGIWIPLGATHPLGHLLEASPGCTLVLGEPWESVSLDRWTSLYEQLDVVMPGRQRVTSPDSLPRLPVTLRLVDGGTRRTASLWVLRDDGLVRVERLLQHLPDEVVDRLLFAVADDVVVLRARASIEGPPALELQAEPYAPFGELANLFRPVDTTLEPPLRRDRIREVLAPEPHELGWMVRDGDSFRVERIEESAFRPLASWVDYVVAHDETALASWVESATFAFDDWVDVGVEWDAARPKAKAKPVVVVPDEPEPEPEVVVAKSRPVRALTPKPVPVVVDVARSTLSNELIEAERRFKALEAPFDDAEVLELWRLMARLHRALGNQREASLASAHAVWESDDPQVAVDWAELELGAIGMDLPTLRIAVLNDDRPEILRAMGAVLAAGELQGDAQLSPVFNRATNVLDVRTAWLARERLAAGDELSLSRARDALLGRIREGLQIERDVPAFIRSLDADEATGVVEHLEAQLRHFRTTKRKRTVIEADSALTGVYVDAVFAWGFAASGDRERAEALIASATTVDRTDPVHDALLTAYEARVVQALGGAPREAPLPAHATEKFTGLSSFHRYQVDRLRSASGILETQERLDPFTTFELGYDDPRGPEFAPLRTVTDTAVLEPALKELLATASGHDEQERLLDGILDFLPSLAANAALPLLDATVDQLSSLAAVPRVRLFTDALMVAGLLGRVGRARLLADHVESALGELGPGELGQVAGVLSGSLRSLRRVGLVEEGRRLLDRARLGLLHDPADPASPWRVDHPSRVVRAGLIGGLLALRVDGALDELDALIRELDRKMIVKHRLELSRAIGVALASAPRLEAFERLPRLSAHLPEITDSFNTNSHFCLSVVGYAESVVLGYADTELGSAARAWIDASEFRVRRRIHRGR